MSLLVYHQFVKRYGRLPTEIDPDYLEMLRMSKYRILDVPDLKPGKCANCGSSKNDGRKYVDFGLEVDWFGIVFICGICLGDVARQMGLFKVYEDKIAELESKLKSFTDLKTEGKVLQDVVLKTFEEVKEYFVSLHSTGDDSSSSSDASVVPNKKPNEQGTTKTSTRTTQSNSSGGSKNLPSLADLLSADT